MPDDVTLEAAGAYNETTWSNGKLI